MGCSHPTATAERFVGRASETGDRERLDALALVRSGRVVELSHELRPHAPHFRHVQPPFLMNLWTTANGVIKALRRSGVTNDAGINLEHVTMTLHVGTHVDALGHFTAGPRMYGGRTVEDTVGDLGIYALGAEAIPPVIARGVLLDVAGTEGGAFLESGRPVTVAMLKAAEARVGVTLRPGDVALVRTGWGRFYRADPARYVAGEPGIDLDAARYLTEAGVVAIASDNMAIEVMPGADPAISMPVHQHALVDCGVYLVENVALDALAQIGQAVFCFVMLAVRYKGGTGSPVRPIALL